MHLTTQISSRQGECAVARAPAASSTWNHIRIGPGIIAAEGGLSDAELRVVLVLEGFASARKPWCFPKLEKIESLAGKARNTLLTILKGLERRGWIRRVYAAKNKLLGIVLRRRTHVGYDAADSPESLGAAEGALRERVARKLARSRPPRNRGNQRLENGALVAPKTGQLSSPPYNPLSMCDPNKSEHTHPIQAGLEGMGSALSQDEKAPETLEHPTAVTPQEPSPVSLDDLLAALPGATDPAVIQRAAMRLVKRYKREKDRQGYNRYSTACRAVAAGAPLDQLRDAIAFANGKFAEGVDFPSRFFLDAWEGWTLEPAPAPAPAQDPSDWSWMTDEQFAEALKRACDEQPKVIASTKAMLADVEARGRVVVADYWKRKTFRFLPAWEGAPPIHPLQADCIDADPYAIHAALSTLPAPDAECLAQMEEWYKAENLNTLAACGYRPRPTSGGAR
jgi:Helix-turn-helix domain